MTPSRSNYSRLAWELARRANMTADENGYPYATVILADGAEIRAGGLTSSDAMGKLAEELDRALGRNTRVASSDAPETVMRDGDAPCPDCGAKTANLVHLQDEKVLHIYCTEPKCPRSRGL